MLQIKLLQNEVFKKMAEAQISWPIGFEQIEIQRLKKQAAVKEITRTHIVAVSLHEVGPRRLQKLDFHGRWLLVAPDVELDRVALEFAFYYFLKIRALAIQFNVPITGNRMTIDREKNITGPKNTGRWPGFYHCAHQHAAIVIF